MPFTSCYVDNFYRLLRNVDTSDTHGQAPPAQAAPAGETSAEWDLDDDVDVDARGGPPEGGQGGRGVEIRIHGPKALGSLEETCQNGGGAGVLKNGVCVSGLYFFLNVNVCLV